MGKSDYLQEKFCASAGKKNQHCSVAKKNKTLQRHLTVHKIAKIAKGGLKITLPSTLINTTLCYIEKDGCYLMLHRNKKKNDYNHDKWIGIGGKFENGESPQDCVTREVLEETGLSLDPCHLKYCGIVTFVDTSKSEPYTEFMHVFNTCSFSGEIKTDCQEGDLEWVPVEKLNDLPHWKGDEIFIDFVAKGHPFFSLKLVYKNNELIQTFLEGQPYNHFEE